MNIFGNNNGERQDVSQALEAIKADYDRLKQEIESRDAKIAELEQQLAVYKAQDGQAPVPTEVVTPTPETKPAEVVQPIVVDCTAQIEELKAAIAELKAQNEKIAERVERRNALDESFRDMHKELDQYKADFFVKIQKPFLMAIMDLHHRFYETYTHFDSLDNTDADMSKLYNDLMQQFKVAIDAISDRAYNEFGVEYFEPKAGDAFDPKMHQALSIEETSESENNRLIAKVLYGGFKDIDTGKVLRHARIVCYKYVEPKLEEKPAETPEEKPAEVPEERPAETPEERPAEVPEERPAEIPEERPAEVPEEKPVEEAPTAEGVKHE